MTREKYSELKLQANFLMASPSFLVATPQNQTNGTYTSSDQLNMSPVLTNTTGYWVVRHAFYDSKNTTRYQLKLPTSAGNITIPQICGSLQLVGRDSKVRTHDPTLDDSELSRRLTTFRSSSQTTRSATWRFSTPRSRSSPGTCRPQL